MDNTGNEPQEPGNAGPVERQPVFLLPGVVTALIGSMTAIQLADSFVFNNDARELFTIWFAFIPARILGLAGIPGDYWPLLWTPFTHAFMHAGFEHLILNCAWLAIFATPVARRYGAMPTVILFLASAFFGALAFAAGTLPQVQVLVGASGGVAGLTGAATRFIFQPVITARHPETGEVLVLGRQLASIRQVMADPRARGFTLIWLVINAAVPILPLLVGTELQIAWQAHLGGFLAGFFLVPLFERRG